MNQKNVIKLPVSCARCEQDHDLVKFFEFTRPPERWTHFGMCPKLKEPILLRIEEDD